MDQETIRDLEYLYQRRENMDKNRFISHNNFDNYIFAFSFSILLILMINKHSYTEFAYCFFVVASVAFVVSLVLNLLSVFFTVQAHRRQVQIIDQKIKTNLNSSDQIDYIRHKPQNRWNDSIKYTNFFTIISFLLGVIFSIILFFTSL